MTIATDSVKLTRTDELVSLVGWRFHTFTDQEDGCRTVAWQGIVEAKVADGLYMVMTFDWLVGGPGPEILVTVAEMVRDRWEFYQTADDMQSSYEAAYQYRSEEHARHRLARAREKGSAS